ncbi:MAG: hypothetical protein HYZ87_02170, partial [Candidatus Omnitrophica bacterium]|nr:hypothetical protein [Candidatus Omnitrophota bacterium]
LAGNYFGILAFLPDRPPVRKVLAALAKDIRHRTRCAVTIGIGPRYLHSTGQLHKGGPGNGAFLLLTTRHSKHLKIPGEKYSFAELELAQAMGDLAALQSKGRRVHYQQLSDVSKAALERFTSCVKVACRF